MTNLLDQALDMDNLRQAWEEVDENKGKPGADNVSLKQWRRNWEERLQKLIHTVRANTYRPHKLRLRRIPKKTPGEFRTLSMPTITDRVFQRAVLQVLHPVFEPHFMDCSYGYRPKRSVADAVQRMIVLRENEYRWLLDADIDAFFDNVDHKLLLDFLEHDLPDRSLLPLIKRWLAIGRVQVDRHVGIPLGSPLSPLWANVFLHRLDKAVAEQGWEMVRYADDFMVFAESPDEVPVITEAVGQVLAALKLRYEPTKTHPASFEEGFEFLGVHFEGDEYSYEYQGKEVTVGGTRVDWLFRAYGPEYE